jgi:hypothetical protein
VGGRDSNPPVCQSPDHCYPGNFSPFNTYCVHIPASCHASPSPVIGPFCSQDFRICFGKVPHTRTLVPAGLNRTLLPMFWASSCAVLIGCPPRCSYCRRIVLHSPVPLMPCELGYVWCPRLRLSRRVLLLRGIVSGSFIADPFLVCLCNTLSSLTRCRLDR